MSGSIPETKNVMLEEMDTLFGGSNRTSFLTDQPLRTFLIYNADVEKGGDLLHVEDVHHVNLDHDQTVGTTQAERRDEIEKV